ncbi:MAG: hypothetical protein LH616_02740 [Ilumatobacteraceae bacterium]|nr:hypothetical protein [Ilumatobacteraceae bacterium]
MSPFLSEESAAALAGLAAAESATPTPPPLERLRGIRDLFTAIERDPATLQAVRDALANDIDWGTIASTARLKPAAAKWRWQGTDNEIAARQEAGRRRAARPSNVPTDLPGLSVSQAAKHLGLSPQAIYLRISRGNLRSETVELADGRRYKRVHLD